MMEPSQANELPPGPIMHSDTTETTAKSSSAPEAREKTFQTSRLSDLEQKFQMQKQIYQANLNIKDVQLKVKEKVVEEYAQKNQELLNRVSELEKSQESSVNHIEKRSISSLSKHLSKHRRRKFATPVNLDDTPDSSVWTEVQNLDDEESFASKSLPPPERIVREDEDKTTTVSEKIQDARIAELQSQVTLYKTLYLSSRTKDERIRQMTERIRELEASTTESQQQPVPVSPSPPRGPFIGFPLLKSNSPSDTVPLSDQRSNLTTESNHCTSPQMNAESSAEVQQLRHENQRLQKERDTAYTKNAKLADLFARTRADELKLQNSCQEFQAQIASLNQKLEEAAPLAGQIQELEGLLRRNELEKTELQKKIRHLEADLDSSQNQTSSTTNQIFKLAEDLDKSDMESQRLSYEKESVSPSSERNRRPTQGEENGCLPHLVPTEYNVLSITNEGIMELRAEYEIEKAASVQLETMLEDAMDQLEVKRKTITRLEAQLQEKEVRTSALENQLADLSKQLHLKSDRIDHTEKQITGLQAKLLENEALLERAIAEKYQTQKELPVAQLEDGNAMRINQREMLGDENNEQTNGSNGPENCDQPNYEEMCSMLDDRALRITELEQWLDETLAELEDKDDQFSNELSRLHVELDEKENQVNRLQSILEESSVEFAKREDQLRSIGAHYEMVSKLQSELAATNSMLDKAQLKIKLLESTSSGESFTGFVGDGDERMYEYERLRMELEDKEHDMNLLRHDIEEYRGRIGTLSIQVEEMEHERNYNRAKLNELSHVLEVRNESEAHDRLYEKSIKCAEMSAEMQTMKQKLSRSDSQISKLEQECALNRELVQSLSDTWDAAAMSSGENISRLKAERDRSLKRATELSIQLAESQMKIDLMREQLKSLGKTNRVYAEQLTSMNASPASAVNALMKRLSVHQLSETSKHGGEESEHLSTIQKMKQKIAILEDENAAYAASLAAIKQKIEAGT